MELERRFIERTDFSAARRGYDPDEVDRHLQAIADVAETAAAEAPSPGDSLGSVAAEQVRVIVEAAENSASDIETSARAEAVKLSADATREAEEMRTAAEADALATRTNAESEAAGHVQRVQDATTTMTTKAESIDSELDGLVTNLRSTVGDLTERLRREAEDLTGQLEELREGLSDVRAAAPGGPAATVGAGGGAASTIGPVGDDVLVDVDEEEAEVAYEAATEEEPELVEAEAIEVELVEEEPVPAVDEPTLADDEEPLEVVEETPPPGGEGSEGARLIALNMALNGTPRDETARYLEENFDLPDQDSILDEVYARAGG